MNRIKSTLGEGEEIIMEITKNSALIQECVLIMTFFGTIAYIFSDISFYISLFILAIGIFLCFCTWIISLFTEMAITNKRVISRVGFIFHRHEQMPLTKIEEVRYIGNVIALFSRLEIMGSGGSSVVLKRIDDINGVQSKLNSLIT